MAQKTIVTVTDDINGDEDATTVSFSYKGTNYEIDLAKGNAEKLDAELKPYIEHARKISAAQRKIRRSLAHRERSAEIRAWAKQRGIEVEDRGRIPAHVVKMFEAWEQGKAA